MNTLQKDEARYLRAIDAYYDGNPIMSNAEFDIIEKRLKDAGSAVINRVGTIKAGEYSHITKMLSLDKISVYDNDNLPLQEINKFLTTKRNQTYEITGKFDGSAVNAIYDNKGNLLLGLTRGDGEKGFDITPKLKHFIPTKIDLSFFENIDFETIEIRGECVCTKHDFDTQFQPKWNEWNLTQQPKNGRNFVSGILKRDDVNKKVCEKLHMMAFEARLNYSDGSYRHVGNVFKWFESISFNKIKMPRWYFSTIDEYKKLYKTILDYRINKTPFQLDGMVIKMPAKVRSEMGESSKYPKWAIAIKFPPEQAMSKLLEIEHSIRGHLGEIIPVAILSPIDIDGTTVSRATLHNWGRVEDYKIDVGADLILAKGGDIIPGVCGVAVSTGTVYKRPTTCPCKLKYPTKSDGVHLYCCNDKCPSMEIGRLNAGLKVLDRKNIGDATVKLLYEAGIKTIKDIFFPTAKELELFLIRSGKFKTGRSLEIIVNSVYKKKSYTLAKIIQSCKFKGCGETISIQIANYINGVSYDWTGLERDVVDRLIDENSEERLYLKSYLKALELANINIVSPKTGHTKFEMTNSPKSAGFKTKEEFIEFVESHGYEPAKLNKDCDLLITEALDINSGKMEKAKKLGIPIKTYSEVAKSLGWKKSTPESTKQDQFKLF